MDNYKTETVNMNRPFKEYELYVFDLDGTLYFQKELRAVMAIRLLTYYICHPFHIRELFILKKFRSVRENWKDTSEDIDRKQYEYVAKAYGTDAREVEKIVKKWIYDNPLDAVARSKDERLIEVIRNIRSSGSKAVIFSDYPTEDKLNALGVQTDGQYCSADKSIGELKPSGKGLKVIFNDFSAKPEDVIMIGDRFEKDGMSAIDAGCDYLILQRSRKKRGKCYRNMAL